MTELSRVLPSLTGIYRALSQEATDGCASVCTEVPLHVAGDAYERDRAGDVTVVLWTGDERRYLQGQSFFTEQWNGAVNPILSRLLAHV